MNASYKPVDIPAFDCKGSVLTVMVLHLRDTEPEILYPQLEEKIGRARAFFANAPMLIDLRSVDGPGQAALDLPTLVATLRDLGVVPVGLRGALPLLHEAAREAGLGLLAVPGVERTVAAAPPEEPVREPEPAAAEPAPPEEAPAPEVEPAAETPAQASPGEEPAPAPPLPAPAATTVTVTQPVRSGQQVIAPHGDLVVLSSVNAGAEVFAAGSIHVYGALRGRALAGIDGDTTARVYSLQFNPELVAVAGEYLVNESLSKRILNRSVSVSLVDGVLRCQPLGTFTQD